MNLREFNEKRMKTRNLQENISSLTCSSGICRRWRSRWGPAAEGGGGRGPWSGRRRSGAGSRCGRESRAGAAPGCRACREAAASEPTQTATVSVRSQIHTRRVMYPGRFEITMKFARDAEVEADVVMAWDVRQPAEREEQRADLDLTLVEFAEANGFYDRYRRYWLLNTAEIK